MLLAIWITFHSVTAALAGFTLPKYFLY